MALGLLGSFATSLYCTSEGTAGPGISMLEDLDKADGVLRQVKYFRFRQEASENGSVDRPAHTYKQP
jgi:hypothetical protein